MGNVCRGRGLGVGEELSSVCGELWAKLEGAVKKVGTVGTMTVWDVSTFYLLRFFFIHQFI